MGPVEGKVLEGASRLWGINSNRVVATGRYLGKCGTFFEDYDLLKADGLEHRS